ncbi:hypothetical protein CA265_12210 [Sphingobacteriaceae bacterium GW460-11-11-14-LB5]|nr:hypothetical protein CA265_12210 [Sphingobacteriaceae bacterium GW460-11-11-14-LB5]
MNKPGDKIKYREYLDALDIVLRFSKQLQSDFSDSETPIDTDILDQAETLLLDVLQNVNSIRLFNVLSLFLDAEIKYGKIPFGTSDKITVSFFVTKYRLQDLRKIRNFGSNARSCLTKALSDHGYTLLP